MSEKYKVIQKTEDGRWKSQEYPNSSYRNYEEDNTIFCNVNAEPFW